MSYLSKLERFTKTEINGKTTGAIKIGTTENGTQRFHALFVVVKTTSVSLFISAGSLSVGTNSASYNNVLPITLLTGMNTVNMVLKTDMVGAVNDIAPNTDIYVNITTGFLATTAIIEVTVFGYYQ